MPPDPYERLQAARKTVKALQDERSALAVRLAELARGGDQDDLESASARLDSLPGELLRAELRLTRADHQAARATLQAAEASLGAVRTDLDERGPADAAGSEGGGATGTGPGTPGEDAAADPDEPDDQGGGGRRAAEEQWVRDCRLAVERAERRARELQAAVDRTPAAPVDETVHRGFAKRVAEARDAIERARSARHQAELDLIQTTELARVALDGLADAGAGADWRSLEQAREARTAAAAAVGPAWEALRWAGLRVARAGYELDRLVEERLSGTGQPAGG